MLGNQFSDSRYEFIWNFHDSLYLVLKSCLVFRYCFFLGLLLIVSKNPLNPLFIPSWWKLGLFHDCFLRLRRR